MNSNKYFDLIYITLIPVNVIKTKLNYIIFE